MTQDIEIINGHRYLVTRNEKGDIVSMEGRDEMPVVTLPNEIQLAQQIINTQIPLTENQRDQALKLILWTVLRK